MALLNTTLLQMSLLRAASRSLAPSPSSLSAPRLISRAYSTEQSSPTDQAPSDTHRTQRAPRTRSLRQVSEGGGAQAKLIALAVSNTAKSGAAALVNGGHEPRPHLQRQRSENGGRPRQTGPRPPRQPRTAPVDGELLEGTPSAGVPRFEVGGGGGEGQQLRRPRRSPSESQDSVLGAALSSRRSSLSPEAAALRRSPRSSFDSASSPRDNNGAPRKPRDPSSRPKGPRRDAKSSGPKPSSVFSADEAKALNIPTSVRTPSANLANLLRADLAARTLQVKAAVGAELSNENAEKQEDREQARKVLGGDYSIWSEAGGVKGDALEHARSILRGNPSVGLSGREALLSKVKEVLL